jgi:hypothetical protein
MDELLVRIEEALAAGSEKAAYSQAYQQGITSALSQQ